MTVPFLKMYSELLIQHLPSSRRVRDGRHGGADSDQQRSGCERSGARESARGQAARSQRRPRRHLGRASGARCRSRARSSMRTCRRRISSMSARLDVHRLARRRCSRRRDGTITRAGFEGNIEVCLRYLAAWLDGLGCVPIHHLMEDAATAEISRTQLWQWLHARQAPSRRHRDADRFRPVRRDARDRAPAPCRDADAGPVARRARGRTARRADARRHARRFPHARRVSGPALTIRLPSPHSTNETTMKNPLPTVDAIKLDWANNPRWNGVKRNYTAEDVVRLRGTVHVEHSLARIGAEKLWSYSAQGAVRQRARRADRQSGDAAGQGRPEGDLSFGLAGRGRRERRRRDVSGSVAVSGELRAAWSSSASTTRCCAPIS